MKTKMKSLVAGSVIFAMILTGISTMPVMAAENRDTTVLTKEIENTTRTVPGYYGVIADALRVRSGPGTQYTVLGLLQYGTAILVTSIDRGWAKFDYNGVDGYVKAEYLEEYKG